MSNKALPITDEIQKFGSIHYFAYKDLTCYIIHGEHGDLLIDTGWEQTWDEMKPWLGKYKIKHIALTHAHPDHAWNASKIKDEYGAKIILGKEDAAIKDSCASQKCLPCFSKYRFRTTIINFSIRFCKTPPFNVDFYVGRDDAQLLKKFGYDAEIVPLPGHTYGSIGILSDNVLYCGDEFTAIWKKPDIAPHGADIEMLRNSLKTILEINPEWLACGHGLPVKMQDARPVIEDYINKGYR